MFYNLNSIVDMHPLFQALENCRGHTQRADYHPEGCLFSHSVQTLNHALRESSDIDLIIAAMIHDVGKQIDSHGHDKYSCQMLKGHLSVKTDWLVANHIRIKDFLDGNMKKVSKVRYLAEHEWFKDVILLHRWDVMGRNPNYVVNYSRVDIIDRLKNKVLKF